MLAIRKLLSLQLSTKPHKQWLILSLIIVSFIGRTSPTSAQIVPDATLPSNSLAIPDASGNLIDITGGTTSGNNLFHSFQEFSVLNGQTASFNNGLTIENILTRVTGNSISNIDGLIEANGTANLFLINPNGIIFGENASLDIGGSFLGSTADSIQFSDGSFYSAVNPQTPPLLEINIPIGLQYGANAGNIIVTGSGNSTGFTDAQNNDLSLIKDFRPAGLQVPEGNSLALIGGNIALDGGNLTAAGGHIELGSVTEGLVKLDSSNWTFDYQDVAGFKDIALVNAASVEVSGNSSGTVNVQGQNITLSDASAILSNTSGDGTAGSINLNGTESVQVTGISQNEIPFVSYVSTGTTFGSTGEGADLNIDTNYLLVAGGAIVDSPVFGSGDGGDINVKAEQVELIAGSPIAGSSGLISPIVPGATGEGGDINVTTNGLLVAGGAQAFTLSVSSSQAGDFNIDAQEIELTGTSPNGTPSGLFTNTFANGNAGNLNIETDSFLITNGAEIASAVFGIGTGGTVNIKANTIELNNDSDEEFPSQISTQINPGAVGIGGDINIETSNLILGNGTQITSNILADASGEAGDINISAQEINLTGFSTSLFNPSALLASIVPGATGDSGDITIATNNLTLAEGAQIAVSTGSSDSAGDLTINVSDSVELTGHAIDLGGGSSGLFSSAALADGDGGNIDLNTNRLVVKDGATISASNFISGNRDIPPGTGEAGDININAQSIEVDGIDLATPASITAATFDGGGGNIALNSNSISITNGAQVTTETSGAGVGGLIAVSSDRLDLNNTGTLSSSTVATGDAGAISVTSNLLNISTEGTITTSSIGTGQAGDISLSINEIQANQGLIIATSEQTGGGDISFITDSIFLDNQSLISTSVLDSNGGGGNIIIDNSNLILARDNSDIRANAVFGPGGNIDITSELLVTDFNSDIDASSRFGTDGVVEIRSPNSEEELAKAVLPGNIIDTRNLLISSSCPVSDDNSFAVTGNGGIPQSPYQPHSLATTWNDLRSVNEEIEQVSSLPTFLQEATNIIVNSEGNLELVALAPLSTGNWVQSSCSK